MNLTVVSVTPRTLVAVGRWISFVVMSAFERGSGIETTGALTAARR
jgi:hypothetical protein